MNKRIDSNDLRVEYEEIDRGCHEYEFSCIQTADSITGKNSIWKTFTTRNDTASVQNLEPHFGATIDDQGNLVHFGRYKDGVCLSGIYLDQDEEAAILPSKLTSVTYIKGEISSSSHWGESVDKSISKKRYRAWVIDAIRDIEENFYVGR